MFDGSMGHSPHDTKQAKALIEELDEFRVPGPGDSHGPTKAFHLPSVILLLALRHTPYLDVHLPHTPSSPYLTLSGRLCPSTLRLRGGCASAEVTPILG